MWLRLAVLKSAFNSYNGSAYALIFLFMAVIYLLLRNKKTEQNLLIYEIFGILLLVTPFVGNKILTIGAGGDADWSVYGILCAIPVTAYVAVEALKETATKKERCMLGIALLIVMQFGLGFSVTGDQFGLPQNTKKISETTMSIVEELDLTSEVHVMAPMELAGELREYSTDIHVLYDESYPGLQQDLELLQREADVYGYDCIILDAVYDNEEIMETGGYEKKACVESYVIYIKDS